MKVISLATLKVISLSTLGGQKSTPKVDKLITLRWQANSSNVASG